MPSQGQSKQNVEDSYREFLRSDLFQDENYKQLNRKGEIYKEDIPALIYLSFLLDKPDIKTRYDHIFFDEGQDRYELHTIFDFKILQS